jgi:hypothetical protein
MMAGVRAVMRDYRVSAWITMFKIARRARNFTETPVQKIDGHKND